MKNCQNCTGSCCGTSATSDDRVTISQYGQDALNFDFSSSAWSMEHFFRVTLTPEGIASCSVGKPVTEMLTALSSVKGIKPESVFLRRQGFIIRPKTDADINSVIEEIRPILTRIYRIADFSLASSLHYAVKQ